MICPKCEMEYVVGINVCADCGENLIPVEEFEGNLVHPSDYCVVYTCSESVEAEMLKANLAGADIEAIIWSQKDRNFPGAGEFSIVKLLVKKTEADDALQIINDINSSNAEEE